MKPELRRKLAATVMQIIKPRLDRLGQIQAEFRQIGSEAGLEGSLLDLTTRGVGSNLQPQIPESLLQGAGSQVAAEQQATGELPPPPPGVLLAGVG